MSTFSSQPLSENTASETPTAQSIQATLLQCWQLASDMEQDLVVYCQSSNERLLYATAATLGLLCVTAFLFWRWRLF